MRERSKSYTHHWGTHAQKLYIIIEGRNRASTGTQIKKLYRHAVQN